MLKNIIILFLLLFQIQFIYSTNYFVDINHPNANDSNDCLSIETPCYTINVAKEKIVSEMKSNPDNITLYIREGLYRLPYHGFTSSLVIDTDENHFFTITNYPDERVQLFGSLNTSNQTWELYNSSLNIWRIPADFLFVRDPTGMFFGNKRVEHQSNIGGKPTRRHDHVWNLIDENHWTKAYDNGTLCPKDNIGCYIYLIPKNGNNPNTQVYELSQRGLGIINSDYIQVKGLEFYYTQAMPIVFYGADYVLIENNIFAHTSNGNDNSYAVHLWKSQGSIVRNNTVYDSKYWGGTANSKGITVMINKFGDPNIIEYNHIYDIPGSAAVGSKGGDHNLIVRNNYVHDVVYAFAPVGFRCDPGGPCIKGDSKYRPGGNWQIYNNIIVNTTQGLYLYVHEDNNNNVFHDNLIINSGTGIYLHYNKSFNHSFYNNIFLNNIFGIYLKRTDGIDNISTFFNQYDSDYNLFYNNEEDIHFRKGSGGNIYSGTEYNLTYFNLLYSEENNSIFGNPLLSSNYVPDKDSIVCGAGRFGDDIGPIDCSDRKLDLESPSKVPDLNYSFITNTSVNLTWNLATDNVQVEGYEIVRNNVKVGDVNGIYFEDLVLLSNTTYTYKVRAYDNSSNLGLYSEALTLTTHVSELIQYCGNNITEGTEKCDGSNLSLQTCQSFDFDKGFLSCQSNCEEFDISSCENDDDSGGSSGGGSGGGGGSSFSPVKINKINFTEICISSFKYFEWSLCEEGEQSRFIEDINDCEGDDYETRICKKELSNEENLLLNAKNINLNKIDSKKYKASLDPGYNEIFYIEEKLEDEIFLFVDESTNGEYYAQYYDQFEGKYYYTLKRVDEGVVTILQEEGILDYLIDEDKNSNFLVLVVVFLFLSLVIGFVFYYKRKL